MNGNYEAVQAKAMVAKGCQISVITVRKGTLMGLFSIRRITHRIVDQVDVYECQHVRFPSRFKCLRRFNRFLKAKAYKQVFKKCVKEQGLPDVTHAHIISCAAFVTFVKEKYHIPLVITEHWTKVNVPTIPSWLRGMASAYHCADQVVCVSQALSDSLKRNFLVNSIVINNMVSDLFFHSSKIERHDKQFKFIAVGAFRKNKGFDVLVEAFALGQFPTNISLDIVGGGDEYRFVEKLIQEKGLSGQVNLLGVKTPDEVSQLLCGSDCFVLSSRLETFAIVVIEAMAKGLPVIATRSGGPETFLRPEHGILIQKDNVEELMTAMKEMIMHHSEYDPCTIRNYCYDHFSQDAIAKRIIDVYNSVLKNY